MGPNIVVVGSSNTDLVMRVSHLPNAGETVLGDHFAIAAGGKGGNQAVAAARLGATVTFVARLGRDSYGQTALEGYKAEGINTDYITRDDESPSGLAMIVVDQTGENVIAVMAGSNARLSEADVIAAEPAIEQACVLLLQMEIPLKTLRVAARLASRHGVAVVLNPAPAMPIPADVLRQVHVLTPNRQEASKLVGMAVERIPEAEAAARLLLARGLEAVVITLGGQGALVARGHEIEHIPAFDVTPVDTTAAGDAFNGALALGLAQNLDLIDAVRFSNAAGALCVTKEGAQPSLPAADAVKQLLSARGIDGRWSRDVTLHAHAGRE